jgi:hypothetical protein
LLGIVSTFVVSSPEASVEKANFSNVAEFSRRNPAGPLVYLDRRWFIRFGRNIP